MGLFRFMFEFGLGIEISFAQCERYYQAAAARGHALSMLRLAFLKKNGRPGLKMDQNEAKLWVSRIRALFLPGAPQWACNAPSAWDSVARTSANSDPDPLTWLWWAAAECGCLSVQCALGTCYHYGFGLACDPSKAVAWYRKSADQGHPHGQSMLGFCYSTMMGVDHDALLALHYYRQDAMQGDFKAMYNIGWCYETGAGTGINGPDFALAWVMLDKAFQCFHLAAQQDHPNSMYHVGKAFQFGRGVSTDAQTAVSWYSHAAELNEPLACMALARCAKNGYGVPYDLDCALKWVDCAIQMGVTDLHERLHEAAAALTMSIAVSKQGDYVRTLVEAGIAGPFPAAG
ncbi:hypothetical protein GGF32_009745 [Allomyces javanicus]|nr:hypothetical protein GGF32_009745 [Allomyces javanicus]